MVDEFGDLFYKASNNGIVIGSVWSCHRRHTAAPPGIESAWTSASNVPHDFAWVAVFDLFGAAIYGVFPATSAALSKDFSKGGTRIGMLCTIVSVAALTGPPMAGKLIEDCDGRLLAAEI